MQEFTSGATAREIAAIIHVTTQKSGKPCFKNLCALEAGLPLDRCKTLLRADGISPGTVAGLCYRQAIGAVAARILKIYAADQEKSTIFVPRKEAALTGVSAFQAL